MFTGKRSDLRLKLPTMTGNGPELCRIDGAMASPKLDNVLYKLIMGPMSLCCLGHAECQSGHDVQQASQATLCCFVYLVPLIFTHETWFLK